MRYGNVIAIKGTGRFSHWAVSGSSDMIPNDGSKWVSIEHDGLTTRPFTLNDLEDPSTLAVRLKEGSDPVSQYLKSQFTPATKVLLSAYDDGEDERNPILPSRALQQALIEELNRLFNGPALYDSVRFAQVRLTRKAQRLRENNPQGKELTHLNRLLLEEVYREALASSLVGAGDDLDSELLKRWTVLKPSDLNSTDHVKFGDKVALRSSSGYLSARGDKSGGFSNGYKLVGTMPQLLPWEEWTLVNPSDLGSIEGVAFGDSIALKSNAFDNQFLSCGAANGSPVLRAALIGSVGVTENWVVDKANFVPAPRDEDFKEFYKAPPSNRSVILLGTGLTIQNAVVKACSAVPKIGSVLGGLVDYVWPEGGPDIWAMVKDYVEELVREEIHTERVRAFNNRFAGLKQSIERYRTTRTLSKKGIELVAILHTLDQLKVEAVNLEQPQKTLPYLVAVGTVHLAALHEMYQHGPELFTTDSQKYKQQDRAADLKDLKDNIASYSDAAGRARQTAIDWRRGFIEAKEKTRVSKGGGGYQSLVEYDIYILDKMTGHNKWWNRISSFDSDCAQRKAEYWGSINKYIDSTMKAYAESLDIVLTPTKLWRYLDPAEREIPVRKVASLTSGPFGGPGGGEFFDEPSDQRITAFELAYGNYDRVNIITGIRFKYGETWAPWRGRSGSGKTETLNAGERIIQANGLAGKFVDALYFTTDQGRVLGGGWAGGGHWSARLPVATEPFLAKIGGRAGGVLDALSLHWAYTSWE
jgi:hypothetical protein